jgi:hypothetical protein
MGREYLLDVSELGPPEPLVQALAALQELPEGSYLRLRHRMKPCHLYAHLEQQGFEADTRQGEVAACEVFIWRRTESDARQAALAAASLLKPWQE